ncbi:sulfur carrier protein ThiS adenylyltransferase ThiF [Ruminococcus sp. CLA-AA-H200]|uniref:Sulfur carrier protein ThiS adenylyltransferase ThiF n=1 Tax=Ruminococcus turbiniformis TaxID=2881258 RepID=A0ABS8FWT3_9FIRM|nr:sulfur carrier protein ThiS adenylyltransferase ThiF [Ruminococcus turbiniformis]MCC2254495.1 sulfur carrier protein ThiS adenylyltransferase ThiF [Ruminococcus turbiniformis]
MTFSENVSAENRFTKAEIQEALCSRHTTEIQKRLDSARVAVAGLGGLGSNVAFALARIGVGHLHLIDFDKVDLTNLNRQQYFMRHVGMNKTDALKGELLDINPYLDIKTDCIRVTEENIPELFKDDPIICEAFDVPENKAMLVNGILGLFTEKIIVSASGMAGYGDSNSICTKKITDRFYLCGDEISDSSLGQGLMAPRVSICAGHEANLITRLIIDGHTATK